MLNAVLLMELLCRADRRAVAVDLGANVGTLTIPMAKAFAPGKIIAFEPVPRTASDLEVNLGLNDGLQVDVRRVACSATPGRGTMYDISEANPGIAKLRPQGRGRTPITTLDRELANQRVALIKMDIEGHEPEALLGAQEVIERSRPLILCECLPHVESRTKDILAAFGYESVQVMRGDWLFYQPG